jgi:hypothetical protein
VVPPDAAPSSPDAAPAPADAAPLNPPGTVYFVVGNVPPSAADDALARRLQSRQLQVMLIDDDRLLTVDTTGAALILVSTSAVSTKVGARFRDVPQPVMLSESLLYDDMGMVNARVSDNRGTQSTVTSLHIDDPSSPLAAGQSGVVQALSMPTGATWGQPSSAAVAVASIADQPSLVAIFSYEKGAQMPELVAPARRVGFFLSLDSASYLTANGQALFDAAVDWAMGR